MKKRKKIVMVLIAFTTFGLFQITGCEKEDPAPTYPVAGIWIGTYTTNQVTHTPAYASFIIYPDGVFMKRNKVVGNATEFALTRGRWTLTGNTFTYRDTTLLYSGAQVIETGTATFNNNGTMTNATWQNISGQTYTGNYQNMTRVN